jgi:hypothetical protein
VDDLVSLLNSLLPQQTYPYLGKGVGTTNLGNLTPIDYSTKDILEAHKNLNFVDRLYNKNKYPQIDNGDGTYSTHKMSSSDNIAYPTIVYINGKLQELDPESARNYALKTGEFIKFNNEQEADKFANNGYKKAFPPGYF